MQMSHADDHTRAYLLFDQSELEYNFGAEHPMQPRRLVSLMDLLESSGLWQRSGETITTPPERVQLPLRPATDEELELVHTADYIAAVKHLSLPEPEADQQEGNNLAFLSGLGE